MALRRIPVVVQGTLILLFSYNTGGLFYLLFGGRSLLYLRVALEHVIFKIAILDTAVWKSHHAASVLDALLPFALVH